MNIIKESMNRPFGCLASVFILALPPAISITFTLVLERMIGTLVCIVIFPIIYVLSLFFTILGITYLTKISERKNKRIQESVLEDRVGQLERVVGKLGLDFELLKNTIEKKLLPLSDNNNNCSSMKNIQKK